MRFLEALELTVVAIGRCVASPLWAKLPLSLGRSVELIPLCLVKPYVSRGVSAE